MSFETLRNRARAETEESLQLLIDIRDDEKAPQKDRMAAAKAIGELAYGKNEARKAETEFTYQPKILLGLPTLDELYYRRIMIDGVRPEQARAEKEAAEASQVHRSAVVGEERDEEDDQGI